MKQLKHIYKSIINNPITSLGGAICLLACYIAVKGDVANAVPLIGAGGTIIGLASKDDKPNA